MLLGSSHVIGGPGVQHPPSRIFVALLTESSLHLLLDQVHELLTTARHADNGLLLTLNCRLPHRSSIRDAHPDRIWDLCPYTLGLVLATAANQLAP
jgi:hypothetical protein